MRSIGFTPQFMTKRARHIAIAAFVFVVMTALAILFGLGPAVFSFLGFRL